MELKTLKEILDEKIYDSDNCGYTWNIGNVENTLREEIIKWIKELIKSEKYELPNGREFIKNDGECDDIGAIIDWIKYFFNIKEEDLK
jgi:hypothetical protein